MNRDLKHAGWVMALLGLLAPAGLADELTTSDGVRIHYTVEGQGEPVVLIHGLTASAALNWKLPGMVDRLAATHQVIALDLRGHGRSGAPTTAGSYGQRMTDDVVELLDALGIERARVVGYSLGGMIALDLAVRHPGRVVSVVLGGMGWLREGSALQRVWEVFPVPRRVPEACVREIGQLALSESELRTVSAPLTVVVGERDPCRRLYVEPLTRVRPEVPVHVVPGEGHMTCPKSSEFARRVEEALQPARTP